MKSKIRQAISLLEEANNNIEEKNYRQVENNLYQAYQLYQEIFEISGMGTMLIVDRIIEICKSDPELNDLLVYYQEERNKMVIHQRESYEFFDY